MAKISARQQGQAQKLCDTGKYNFEFARTSNCTGSQRAKNAGFADVFFGKFVIYFARAKNSPAPASYNQKKRSRPLPPKILLDISPVSFQFVRSRCRSVEEASVFRGAINFYSWRG
ncbi:hypothetical protein ABID21_001059 [Pseudorhizobium tarimense]|uniref:Uncharacterized protein n=1 Tax=Pseudorhizobium tarimense TaxID=1079109 RepID=A0ABV2H350_9HYPH|nr:hypothetical protein [Pseudorhizobium tarimense]MCJ8518055.1 hypothetical protein [Pseudorhizobium tarimense]